jgi:hypothetical protein
MAVVLASGGSFLGRILLVLRIYLFWLDDVIMTSPALFTDVVHTSSELLPIVVGVALIKLRGVNFVFLMVSPKYNSTFLVLPNPTPYQARIAVLILALLHFLAQLLHCLLKLIDLVAQLRDVFF